MNLDLENLSKQGEYSSIDNMRRAITDIDETFGDGYSKEHPELLGQIVLASAIDYCGTVLHNDLENLTIVALQETIDSLKDSIRLLKEKYEGIEAKNTDN